MGEEKASEQAFIERPNSYRKKNADNLKGKGWRSEKSSGMTDRSPRTSSVPMETVLKGLCMKQLRRRAGEQEGSTETFSRLGPKRSAFHKPIVFLVSYGTLDMPLGLFGDSVSLSKKGSWMKCP